MFGLTKREQRWKAEQKALESLIGLTIALVESESRARIVEAKKPPTQVLVTVARCVDCNGELYQASSFCPHCGRKFGIPGAESPREFAERIGNLAITPPVEARDEQDTSA